MQWREMRVGEKWHRRTVWRGRKSGWRLDVAPYADTGRWYFRAERASVRQSSVPSIGVWPTRLEACKAAEVWASAQRSAAAEERRDG